MSTSRGRLVDTTRYSTAYFVLLASYCLLRAAYFVLPTSYCLLSAVYFVLPTSCCLLRAAYSVLPTLFCLLRAAYLILPTSCCLLRAASFRMKHQLVRLTRRMEVKLLTNALLFSPRSVPCQASQHPKHSTWVHATCMYTHRATTTTISDLLVQSAFIFPSTPPPLPPHR